jgi:hypothetical protein
VATGDERGRTGEQEDDWLGVEAIEENDGKGERGQADTDARHEQTPAPAAEPRDEVGDEGDAGPGYREHQGRKAS